MRVTAFIILAKSFVVAGSKNGFVFSGFQCSDYATCGVTHGDPPWPVSMTAKGPQVTACINDRIVDAQFSKRVTGNIDRITLGDTTEIQLHSRVC